MANKLDLADKRRDGSLLNPVPCVTELRPGRWCYNVGTVTVLQHCDTCDVLVWGQGVPTDDGCRIGTVSFKACEKARDTGMTDVAEDLIVYPSDVIVHKRG